VLTTKQKHEVSAKYEKEKSVTKLTRDYDIGLQTVHDKEQQN
jgi:predicted DNA-binding protein YlxM (UPF0122 family)